MMAVAFGTLGVMEIKGEMSLKTFWLYHLPLSAVVLYWQLQSTTLLMGKLFFAMPHMSRRAAGWPSGAAS